MAKGLCSFAGMKKLSSVHDAQKKKEEDNAFSVLSDELVVKIFSYLSPEDLLERVPYTSIRFDVLSRDRQLWKDLVLYGNKIGTKRAVDILGSMTQLKTIKLVCTWPGETADDILDALEASQHLESLYMLGVKLGEVDTLNRLVSNCKFLKSVTIEDCFLAKGTPHLMDIFAACSNLQKLSLKRNLGPFADMDVTLERHWSHLKEVNLYPFHSADTEVYVLANSVGAGHLQKLTITHLRERGSYLRLAMFQNLGELCLLYSHICDDGLLGGIGAISGLRNLSIHDCSLLQAPAICDYFSAPHVIANLQTLELNAIHNLDDACLSAISGCSTLNSLTLIECDKITSEGVYDLQEHRPDLPIHVKDCCDFSLVIEWLPENDVVNNSSVCAGWCVVGGLVLILFAALYITIILFEYQFTLW